MKKVRLEIKLNVNDSFKIGDCKNCPLATIKEKEVFFNIFESECFCSIGYSPKSCPLEEIVI